jgi:hypothetical protein
MSEITLSEDTQRLVRTDDYNTGHYLPLEPYLEAQKAKKNP